MNKGKIVFYDNEPEFTTQFEKIMKGGGAFEVVTLNDIERLRGHLKDTEFMRGVKALIFDLAKDAQEASQMKNFEIIKDINEVFHTLRIPIFIHSAFASAIEEFNDLGTVWKKDKSGTSLENIAQIIENLDNSGFLDAFTPGGVIEQSLMEDLHRSFTEQFRAGEIEKIIQSFKNEEIVEFKERATVVFKRIAIRSLLSTLMIDRTIQASSYNEDKISAVEHYIRRINLKNVPIWTGDIYLAKDGSKQIVVMTPRCDLASKGKDEILACLIGNAEELNKKKALEFIRDNIKEKKFRYLPVTPLFNGGKIDFSNQAIIPKTDLLQNFNYVVTLSDDLINEVLGKYCAYLLRTSIPEVDQKELESFLS